MAEGTEARSKLKKKTHTQTQFLNEFIMSEEHVVLCIENVFHLFQNRKYQKHAVVA